jgi:hypothetical protein
MPAVKNKRGNVPAHDKNPDGHAHQRRTYKVYIAQVFGGKEQGISAKAFHEAAGGNQEKQYPEQQQQLVFSEMQKKQLYG